MKKLLIGTILASVIFGTFSLPIHGMYTTVHAAVGIQEYLIPEGAPLEKFNKELTEKAKTGNGAEAAISGTNAFLQFIANGLLYLAAPLAIMFVAHGGMNYAFGFGEQTKIDAAKKEVTWALLGLLVILVSYIAVRMVIGALLGVA